MSRTKLPVYVDGICAIYEDVPVINNFGAKINEQDLVLVADRVPFAEMSYRQSDVDFADQSGFSLSRKIKCKYCNILRKNKKYKMIIESSLYDVSYYDYTRDDTYFYLEYIREVEPRE